MIFAMLPGLLFALFERHGQPLEVVIQQMIQCCFIRPKERPYQTNNAYAALVRQYQMEQEVKAIVQKNDTPRNRKVQKLTRAQKKKLMPFSASTRVTASPARHRPPSRMRPSTRTVCAALTDARSPSALPLRTSAISWPSRKRGPPSLNTCATCTTMWMPPSMCSFRFSIARLTRCSTQKF